MSLIEHSKCPMCRSARPPEDAEDQDGLRPCPDCGTLHTVEDRIVYVSQLRGAVGALTDVRAYAEALKRSPERRAQGIGADLMGLLASHTHRGAGEVRDAVADLLRVLDRFDNAPVSATDAIDRLRAALNAAEE